MELRHLRYFVGVAEELHFARAAARLGISQPPLSQQIRALEDELGVRLFDRSSRSVRLTGAGKAFLEPARATLAQAERAVKVARRAANGNMGELTVGFNASAPFVPEIARAIFDYREAYPDVNLILSELAGTQQLTALEDHVIDIGFMRSAAAPNVPEGIAVTPILSERLFVAMRPDHRLAARRELRFRDLAGEPMLFYANDRSGGFTNDLLALLRTAGVEPVVTQTVHEVSTLFGLAAAGVGIAVMAESLCALQSAKLEYRPIADKAAVTAMWLLHLRDAATLPAQNFLEVIRGSSEAAIEP